jgi:hypothetical protein
MDQTSQQLKDLVAAYGERGAARRLGKQQRQVWGWLTGEHEVRRSNRATIEHAWKALQEAREGVSQLFPAPRRLRALPGRKPTDARRTDTETPEPVDEGVYVLLDDYGARHAAGALARMRPRRPAG